MATSDGLTSAELLDRFRAGDPLAAEELFARYVDGLTRLARSRLAPRIARRTDPEDIVLSAYRSFFLRARDGQFTLQRSGDLWRLLVEMTLHKLYRTVKHHQAEKRSVRREQPLEDAAVWAPDRHATGTPEEAQTLTDELASLMRLLDPFERRVLELRLQDEPLDDIAAETGRSERTVRRALARIRELLAQRLQRDDD